MKVFIVEDELPAQMNLRRALAQNFDDVDIVGTAESIESAVAWLRNPENQADIIFMDVELSDGLCFEIFKRVDVESAVIITTAYDSYAIRAFKVNCIDYLLKPIDVNELIAAVTKAANSPTNVDQVKSMISMADYREGDEREAGKADYKSRFVVKIGDHIIIVQVKDIAYFISRDKTTYIVTREGKSYLLDQSLDMIETLVDPQVFFRISRACITCVDAIGSVSRHFSGRLRISLNPKKDDDIFVSRMRTVNFMKWLNS
jgi:DNA-binding LytR/AlgR family response regulator